MESVVWYRRISFRLFMVTALIVFLPMFLFWNYSLAASRDFLRVEHADRMHTSLYGASLMMQNLMDEVSTFSREVSRDQSLQSAVEEYRTAAAEGTDREAARSRISLILNEYVGQMSSLDSLYLYFPDSKSVVSMIPGAKEIRDPEEYVADFHDFYYNRMEASLEWRVLTAPDGAELLSFLRPLEDSRNCLLVSSLKNSAWKDRLAFLVEEDASYLISGFEGNILYGVSDGRELSGAVNMEGPYGQAFDDLSDSGSYRWQSGGKTMQVAYYNSVESAWKYLMMVPESSFLSDQGLQPGFYLIFAATGILSLILSNLILNRSLVQPVNLLGTYMNASRHGHMAPVPERKQKDEPGVLFDCYNAMVTRQQELMNEVNIQQLLREQTQLNYLQSQMDEHFLFNILNTIYSEACHEKAEHSARMLLVLSKYFRLSLSYGKEKLPLNEIADLLRLYLQLQKMRFGNDLVCHLETFPGMEQYVALKYLFQLIVENAIVHGFEKNPGGHTITISFRAEEDELCFQVEDDGKGMEPEALEQLREEINSRKEERETGFALKNIHEQICLTYGERDIMLESEAGKGMRVLFRIPLEKGV